jgi:predicted ATPase
LFANQSRRSADVALAPSEIERRVHVTLRRLLAALAERGPIVMLLDDLQRLDLGSRELLRVLARGIGGPVLMIAAIQTRADDDAGSLVELRRSLLANHAAVELDITPLGVGELVALLGSMLGRPLHEVGELAELLRHRTGGNPQIIRHLLRELVERDALALRESGWHWDLSAIAETDLTSGSGRRRPGRRAVPSRETGSPRHVSVGIHATDKLQRLRHGTEPVPRRANGGLQTRRRLLLEQR